eukprot:gene2824-3264_t
MADAEEWKVDESLRQDLETYVRRIYQRREVLDVVKDKYPMYSWSLRTLCRRMQYFNIRYVNTTVDIEEIKVAVRKEMEGPGKLLGYRALHRKIREVHQLNVPREIVYAIMTDIDPDGLKARGNVGIARRPKRNKTFESMGPDHTMSLDGHDKLCGFQKSMFPLCIYGAQDTFSGKITILRIWNTNNKPEVIGRFYFDYLTEYK